MANFLEIYNRVTGLPFGGYLFSRCVGFVAPFFGKINPRIVALKPALCVVRMKDRRGIRNHIGTVNAGAMCTLAELTAGMAVDATIPAHLRWIPKGMTVAYLAKGKGMLEATSAFDANLVREGDVLIPVSVRNAEDREVFTAEITFHVSRKKHRESE